MPIKYKLMMSDRVRTLAFKKAIFDCVKKGSVAADLGAGLGILSLFAAEAGARKVYAIEQQEDITAHARSIAERNGAGRKIAFIKGMSSEITLPEKADVIVSETLSTMGIEENIVESLFGARKRFLKKGGRLIPSSVSLYIAPVCSERLFKETAAYFKKNFYGYDFSLLNEFSANRIFTVTVKKDELLAKPAQIQSFDFTKASPEFKTDAVFEIARSGTLHGLAGWFSARLSPQVGLTNSPFAQPTHWQQAFFPFCERVKVRKGMKVRAAISNKIVHERMVWRWNLVAGNKTSNQSSLGILPPKSGLENINFLKHRPKLSGEAKINHLIAKLCDGKKTAEEIALRIRKAYPGKYKTTFNAARKVADFLVHNND